MSVNKLLNGIDVGPPKQRVYWRDLNRFVHEAMNNISNVKVHFKTHSGNLKIFYDFKTGNYLRNKFDFWMALTLVRSNSACVGVA